MTESKELIIASDLTPADIFKSGGMDPILAEIAKKAKAHVPDLTTVKGRNAIKSNAAKVASSKALLDAMGKSLKGQYKVLIDPIDGERRKTREFLDALRDEVRKPFTDWEIADKAKKAAEALAAEQAEWDSAVIADFERAFDEATAEDDLINREREIKAKEAELERIEAERVAKEEAEKEAEAARLKAEQEAKAKAEYEAKLKEEAAAQARADAESAAQKQRDLEKFLSDFDVAIEMNKAFDIQRDIARREQDRLESEATAKFEAEEAARRAEHQRLADVRSANEEAARVEREKQAEIDRLESENQARIAEENRNLAEQKRRDEDKAHRGTVNTAIVEKLMEYTECSIEGAQAFVKAVILGEVDNIKITY